MDINAQNILAGLSEEERSVALQILEQYANTGESDLMDDLKFSDFDEIPVSIDEFLDNEIYLGRGLWQVDPTTGERKCTLFPYEKWICCRELFFGGGNGQRKSFFVWWIFWKN